MNHPEQIYNMDETGMPFDPRPPKVAAPKGLKKVRYRSSGQVTVVGCASASGQPIPPFVIFDAKQLNPIWTKGKVAGTRYGLSDSGWIDRELFHGWLAEHFLRHAVGSCPLLLLLDGHSSHFEPQTIRFTQKRMVSLYSAYLPTPHTRHSLLIAVCDCSLFGPLKPHWTSAGHRKTLVKSSRNSIFQDSLERPG